MVEDDMFTNFPIIDVDCNFMTVLDSISTGKLCLVVVLHECFCYVITDGDIRRSIESLKHEVFNLTAADMIENPALCNSKDNKLSRALDIMEEKKVSSLLVFSDSVLVGVFGKIIFILIRFGILYD